MENTPTTDAYSKSSSDTFARAAEALTSTAESLVMEFRRRRDEEQTLIRQEQQRTIELVQKLNEIYKTIGNLLKTVEGIEPAAAPRKAAAGTPSGSGSYDGGSAKERVITTLRAHPGSSRSDIARIAGVDSATAGRLLQALGREGRAIMMGSRRGATWTAR